MEEIDDALLEQASAQIESRKLLQRPTYFPTNSPPPTRSPTIIAAKATDDSSPSQTLAKDNNLVLVGAISGGTLLLVFFVFLAMVLKKRCCSGKKPKRKKVQEAKIELYSNKNEKRTTRAVQQRTGIVRVSPKGTKKKETYYSPT